MDVSHSQAKEVLVWDERIYEKTAEKTLEKMRKLTLRLRAMSEGLIPAASLGELSENGLLQKSIGMRAVKTYYRIKNAHGV